MAVVKEFSVKHCKKVRILDNAYADLPKEEIERRNRHIKEHFNLIARQQRDSSA